MNNKKLKKGKGHLAKGLRVRMILSSLDKTKKSVVPQKQLSDAEKRSKATATFEIRAFNALRFDMDLYIAVCRDEHFRELNSTWVSKNIAEATRDQHEIQTGHTVDLKHLH